MRFLVIVVEKRSAARRGGGKERVQGHGGRA
jgi:hypothetical protein